MPDTARSRTGRGFLLEARPPLWLLMLYAAMSPFSLLLLFPALPPLAEELGVGLSTIQWVINGFLIGVGAMQLVIGPLVDRLGRRSVVLAGLVLFSTTSAVASSVTDVRWLIGVRVAQAVCVASLSVVSRATVRDVFSGTEAGRAMSFITMALQLPALVAPAIGGALVVHAGWESLFLLLAGIAAILLVPSIWLLPETRPEANEPLPGLARVFFDYGRLAHNPQFTANAAIIALCAAAAMTLLTVFPAALTDLFATRPDVVGYYTSAYSLISMLGALASAQLVKRLGMDRLMSTILVAVSVYLGSYVLWARLLAVTLPNLFLCLSVVGFGQSIVLSMGFARALEADDALRGTASGLAGALASIVSAGFSAAGAALYTSGVSMSLLVVFACYLLSSAIGCVRFLRARR